MHVGLLTTHILVHCLGLYHSGAGFGKEMDYASHPPAAFSGMGSSYQERVPSGTPLVPRQRWAATASRTERGHERAPAVNYCKQAARYGFKQCAVQSKPYLIIERGSVQCYMAVLGRFYTTAHAPPGKVPPPVFPTIGGVRSKTSFRAIVSRERRIGSVEPARWRWRGIH